MTLKQMPQFFFDFTPLCVLINKRGGGESLTSKINLNEKMKVDYLFAEKKSTIGHEDDFSIFY